MNARGLIAALMLVAGTAVAGGDMPAELVKKYNQVLAAYLNTGRTYDQFTQEVVAQISRAANKVVLMKWPQDVPIPDFTALPDDEVEVLVTVPAEKRVRVGGKWRAKTELELAADAETAKPSIQKSAEARYAVLTKAVLQELNDPRKNDNPAPYIAPLDLSDLIDTIGNKTTSAGFNAKLSVLLNVKAQGEAEGKAIAEAAADAKRKGNVK